MRKNFEFRGETFELNFTNPSVNEFFNQVCNEMLGQFKEALEINPDMTESDQTRFAIETYKEGFIKLFGEQKVQNVFPDDDMTVGFSDYLDLLSELTVLKKEQNDHVEKSSKMAGMIGNA